MLGIFGNSLGKGNPHGWLIFFEGTPLLVVLKENEGKPPIVFLSLSLSLFFLGGGNQGKPPMVCLLCFVALVFFLGGSRKQRHAQLERSATCGFRRFSHESAHGRSTKDPRHGLAGTRNHCCVLFGRYPFVVGVKGNQEETNHFGGFWARPHLSRGVLGH